MSPSFRLFQQAPIRSQLHSGSPITAGGWTVTPVSRSLHLFIPFPLGGLGLMWNRPVAMTVQAGDSPARSLPVHDLTRRTQALIWLAALGVILLASIWRRSGGTHDERN